MLVNLRKICKTLGGEYKKIKEPDYIDYNVLIIVVSYFLTISQDCFETLKNVIGRKGTQIEKAKTCYWV